MGVACDATKTQQRSIDWSHICFDQDLTSFEDVGLPFTLHGESFDFTTDKCFDFV
ncbi:hypothetical protein Plhal304r1_c060g0146441 [Plasmopara halstedii]